MCKGKPPSKPSGLRAKVHEAFGRYNLRGGGAAQDVHQGFQNCAENLNFRCRILKHVLKDFGLGLPPTVQVSDLQCSVKEYAWGAQKPVLMLIMKSHRQMVET